MHDFNLSISNYDFITKWIDEITEKNENITDPHLQFLLKHKVRIQEILKYDEKEASTVPYEETYKRMNTYALVYAFRLINLSNRVPPILCSIFAYIKYAILNILKIILIYRRSNVETSVYYNQIDDNILTEYGIMKSERRGISTYYGLIDSVKLWGLL